MFSGSQRGHRQCGLEAHVVLKLVKKDRDEASFLSLNNRQDHYFFPTSIILIFLFLIVMVVIPEEIVKLSARGLFTTVNIRGEVCFWF